MDRLLQDLRFAIRTLAKAPLFTILCILCLAVGIGVNVNVYSAVYAVFGRPLGFAEPDRLAFVVDRDERRGLESNAFAFENFRDLQRQTPQVELAALTFRSISFTDGDEPVRVGGEAISWNLFPLLGVAPHLGRNFLPEEDALGAAPTVILGYDIWATRYDADSTIIGRSVSVNGVPTIVVGVMPRGFMFPEREEAWIPVTPQFPQSARDERHVVVLGRMAPGIGLDAASAALATASQQIAAAHPDVVGEWRATARTMRDFLLPPTMRLVILTMMGAVSFVLLIACANVANLLLARATTRGREVAVRTALGASRGRIVRQMLTESTLLALIACPIGIGLAYWLLDLVKASIPEGDLPYYVKFAIDTPVLTYAVIVAIATGLIFGLAPAMQAARSNVQAALKDGSRGAGTGGRRQRVRSALVVAEVAMAVVLLVGASLFVRSFLNVQSRTGGIDPSNMLTLRFYMPGERYDQPAAMAARVRDVVERVRAIPGVVSVTASNQIPLSGGGSGGVIEIDGRPVPRAEAPQVQWTGATQDWFTTLGVPLMRGRDLTPQEARDSSNVAVINEAMARRFWPEGEPVGRRFRILGEQPSEWFTIVGVSRDYRSEELDDNVPVGPAFVISHAYLPTRNTGLMIRAEREPAQLTPAVRSAIRASDPTLPVFEIMTMEELRRFGFWSVRLFGWMFAMFGGVALVLASVGVYGVIAYSVSQRTQEIGVRVALGAQRRDVIRLVVGGGAVLTVTGIVIGLVGAFGVTRVIQSLLFDVSASDPLSFAGVALFLSAVALLASYVPARRATRVDPLTALRHE